VAIGFVSNSRLIRLKPSLGLHGQYCPRFAERKTRFRAGGEEVFNLTCGLFQRTMQRRTGERGGSARNPVRAPFYIESSEQFSLHGQGHDDSVARR
jgi:hypothetical protein